VSCCSATCAKAPMVKIRLKLVTLFYAKTIGKHAIWWWRATST
jgi:hypothetical protein